jgi:hypothetical protein
MKINSQLSKDMEQLATKQTVFKHSKTDESDERY